MSDRGVWSLLHRKADYSGEVAEKVRECVTAYRNRGMTFERGIVQAAETLHMKERRVRALIFDEAVRIYAEEYQAFISQYMHHLRNEETFLQERLKEIRKKIQDLGNDGWSDGCVSALLCFVCISCTRLLTL